MALLALHALFSVHHTPVPPQDDVRLYAGRFVSKYGTEPGRIGCADR